jgi:hypothetical protein
MTKIEELEKQLEDLKVDQEELEECGDLEDRLEKALEIESLEKQIIRCRNMALKPMKHTPTPWKLVPLGENLCVRSENGDLICDMRLDISPGASQKAQVAVDAAFIVKACNHHEELIQKLTQIRDDLSYGVGLLGSEIFYDKYKHQSMVEGLNEILKN